VPHVPEDLVEVELRRAGEAIERLRERPVDLLSVKSLGPDIDAVLIAKNISKLSPFVSTQLENATIKVLSEVPGESDLDWARQDPGFPDAGLRYQGTPTGHGIEAKAWYVHGTEITARFKASQVLLQGRRVRVLLVAWTMSRILFGEPVVVDFELFDAGDLAKVRDEHYHRPIRYLVVEPGDTADRAANLQQANVSGLLLQTQDERLLRRAELVAQGDWEPPYTERSRAITETLLGMLSYRSETNFAKLDRIDHEGVERFKAKVLAISHLGRTLAEWTAVLAGLTSSDSCVQAAAIEAVKPLYAKP
jgi:hypothetical protein